MEIFYDGIVLRDPVPGDIDDEIRWMNTDTAWQRADMPWLETERVDPDALREEMAAMMNAPRDTGPRQRLEIAAEGRHAGFVTAYRPEGSLPEGAGEARYPDAALGIEICEKDLWGRGIGPRALAAFMEYRRRFGEKRFLLETWSGNARMLRCAAKLGFRETRRERGAYAVDGVPYDAILMEKTTEREEE